MLIKKTMESDGQKIRTNSSSNKVIRGAADDDHDVLLPGFRFHPTDEELVGFYLRRKVEKKAISIELIKQIDIYKYDPWDLPKASNVGDKEWYFFCKRGRKYRNSIRPNRVTGSGFWKATGIDRPIYSDGGEGRDCIGLKKSLVYYRGCAGKGTKTDWMMHEFRLPTDNEKTTRHVQVKTVPQEAGAAEIWTLCRILKRNVSYRKCMPEWKDLSGKRLNKTVVVESSSKTCSSFDSTEEDRENYISFNNAAPVLMNNNDMKPFTGNTTRYENFMSTSSSKEAETRSSAMRYRLLPCFGDVDKNMHPLSPRLKEATSSYNSIFQSSIEQQQQLDFFVNHADWDELRSLVEFGGVISPF